MNRIVNEHNISFFTLVIAGIAVVLSQFPPVYTYFQKEKIKIGINSEIHLSHSFGNIGITKRVTIKNTGDESGEIEKINIFISPKNNINEGITFPAKFHYKNERDSFLGTQAKIQISEFFLAPSTSWDETTVFYRRNSFVGQEMYREIAKRAISEKNKWKWNLRKNELMDDDEIFEYESTNPMRFSEALDGDIQQYIKNKLIWLKKGEHYLVEYIEHNGEKTALFFSFKISDSILDAMKDISNRHSYFIDQFSDVPKGIFVNINKINPPQSVKSQLLDAIAYQN